ncbi:MAG: hypothetical protein ACJ75F_04820, partial [Flavisolibacter sp.]
LKSSGIIFELSLLGSTKGKGLKTRRFPFYFGDTIVEAIYEHAASSIIFPVLRIDNLPLSF